jgi:hypothetical protein
LRALLWDLLGTLLLLLRWTRGTSWAVLTRRLLLLRRVRTAWLLSAIVTAAATTWLAGLTGHALLWRTGHP